jgi:hypothetical protein
MLQRSIGWVCTIFDRCEAQWTRPRTRRALATGFVLLFLMLLALVELKAYVSLPAGVTRWVPGSHFGAVAYVFTFLLVFEVASLIFALAHSVAASLGKQFELLALILMREAFLEFGGAAEPIAWSGVAAAVPHALADMAGALVVFVLLDEYYRRQRHLLITAREDDQASFVRAKKVVSVALLLLFVWLAVRAAATLGHAGVPDFFPRFYTILILSDILIVLISLRFSASFPVVFRNAGFAAATLLVRVALSAPPYVNAAVAASAAVFALALTAAYNRFGATEAGVVVGIVT